MNNLDLYLNAIPSIKGKIEAYPLEITEGTHKVIAEYKIHAAKERNRSVNELLTSYRSDMESIKTVFASQGAKLDTNRRESKHCSTNGTSAKPKTNFKIR